MLTERETLRLATLTTMIRTPDVIEILRAFARTERIGDIAEAIMVVARNCEINGSAKRTFLAARVPGILVNNFFTLFETDWYEALVRFTVQNPTWAAPIAEAAATGAEELERAVSRLEADVRATI